MRIFIECPDSPKEWFMIELQGEIEATLGKKPLKKLDSLKIADLFEKDNKPHLIIGNHELVGQIETLDKPLLAMKKVKDENRTTYYVSGVVRKKYIFSSRPKAILFKTD